MRHGILTFVFKIDPARRERLDRLLASAGKDGFGMGLAGVDTLHFASITILDRPLLDSLLLLECNFDGELPVFIRTLLAVCPLLGKVLACLRPPAGMDGAGAAAMMRAGVHRPAARHVGATGLGVAEIRNSAALVRAMRDFVDREAIAFARQPPAVIAAALQCRFLADAPALKAGLTPAELATRWLLLAARALTIPLLLVVLALRRAIGSENREPERLDWGGGWPQADRGEDQPGHAGNHFISATPLKTGPGRWMSRVLFMGLLNSLAATIYTKGKLGNIPSIHFAHWAVVDEGSTLLFVSNYDGSWGSYLDDFIEKASVGLTGVWSHAQGFPRSRWMVLDGARRAAAFKRYTRDSQTSERVWYCAYPDLTVTAINDNRAILEGLWGRSHETAAIWLRRL